VCGPAPAPRAAARPRPDPAPTGTGRRAAVSSRTAASSISSSKRIVCRKSASAVSRSARAWATRSAYSVESITAITAPCPTRWFSRTETASTHPSSWAVTVVRRKASACPAAVTRIQRVSRTAADPVTGCGTSVENWVAPVTVPSASATPASSDAAPSAASPSAAPSCSLHTTPAPSVPRSGRPSPGSGSVSKSSSRGLAVEATGAVIHLPRRYCDAGWASKSCARGPPGHGRMGLASLASPDGEPLRGRFFAFRTHDNYNGGIVRFFHRRAR
jgi:hypothetical protein